MTRTEVERQQTEQAKAQAQSLAAYAVGRLGITRAVILYPDEAYGRTFMALFHEEFLNRGGQVLDTLAYSPEAVETVTAFAHLLHEHAAKHPEFGRQVAAPAATLWQVWTAPAARAV
jgi:ABC-type branched-subunit amino acid transport system substrate-binding protein